MKRDVKALGKGAQAPHSEAESSDAVHYIEDSRPHFYDKGDTYFT